MRKWYKTMRRRAYPHTIIDVWPNVVWKDCGYKYLKTITVKEQITEASVALVTRL